MTKETDDAINLVVQHFLLDEAKPLADVTDALSTIGARRSFEALGLAVSVAMLKTQKARLQAEKATLIAQGPRGSLH